MLFNILINYCFILLILVEQVFVRYFSRTGTEMENYSPSGPVPTLSRMETVYFSMVRIRLAN